MAKRKTSIYREGKRSNDWIKSKHMLEDDFVIMGYRFHDEGMTSLALGKYVDHKLTLMSEVALGVSYVNLKQYLQRTNQFIGKHYHEVIPKLVCTVKFMGYTKSKQMRQPSFKCLRFDKEPSDCIV